MSDFDQPLYERILTEMGLENGLNPHHDQLWSEGALWTAIAAARISAERSQMPTMQDQQTRPQFSDEELYAIMRDARAQELSVNPGNAKAMEMAGIRAIRVALTPAPIPLEAEHAS